MARAVSAADHAILIASLIAPWHAATHALAQASNLATDKARAAGAEEVEIRHRRTDKVHRDASGLQIFIESRCGDPAALFAIPR